MPLRWPAVSRPGAREGPCLPLGPGVSCEHRHCAQLRLIAKASCTGCGQPLGYDELYVRDTRVPGPRPAYCHLACAKGLTV